MQVKAIWKTACRVGAERVAVEQTYADRLISICGGPVAAWNYHQAHYRCGQPNASQWARFNAVALDEATKQLLPSERRLAAFQVVFVHD